MKSLGLIFCNPFFIRFCFKNLGLLDQQIAHLDLSLTTLFVIVTLFEPILSVRSPQLEQQVCMFSSEPILPAFFLFFFYSLNKFPCFILIAIFFDNKS